MNLSAVGAGVLVASVGSGVGTLGLVWYLRRHLGKPGASWFVLALSTSALFCLAYAAGLAVFDPGLRAVLETVAFVSICWTGPLFLGFALEYTGRAGVLNSPLFWGVLAVPVATTAVGAAGSETTLLWSGFAVDPAFGVAAVTYDIEPFGLFAVSFGFGAAGVASLLLVETILGYGPLYRREALAVLFSTGPPSVGLLLWLLGIGPVNLAPALFLPHVALDAYAFVGTHMFETNPATQRAAERSALDDLSDPLVVLDDSGRIVNANGRAEQLFGLDRMSLPVPSEDLDGTWTGPLTSASELVVDGQVFAVSHTGLTDASGGGVGSLIVCYDVTAQRQRKQRLAMLNRVLRHNLRNEMVVIRGHADDVGGRVDDEGYAEQLERVVEASDRLLSISEAVREFDDLQDRDPQPADVRVADLLADVESDLPGVATVDTGGVPSELTLRTDRYFLSAAMYHLVENAVTHGQGTAVVLRVTESDGRVVFEVSDDNEPIPDVEIEALRSDAETPLQHGQGVGLSIVDWCVQALGGGLTFEYDDGNVVTITVPPLADGETAQSPVG